MIKVHHLIVGRSVFTVWLIEELGLDYELEIYERLDTGRAPATLRDAHPLGKSPVIEDDGRVIAESGAIATYLLERYDPENRLGPARTDLDAWVPFIQWLHYPEGSAFVPFFLNLLGMRSGDTLGPVMASFATAEATLHLGYIADGLGEKPYILGDFSAADIGLGYIASLVDRLSLLDSNEHGGPFPSIKAYLERLQARPAFQRAWERTGG